MSRKRSRNEEHKICILCGNGKTEDEVSMFRFPRNERIDVWLNSIRKHVPNIKTDCKEELTSKFICEHHFDKSAFTNSKRNRLSKFATPTIFNKKTVPLHLPEDKRLCQYSNEEDVSHMKSFAIIDPLGISADKENTVELEEGNNVLLSPCNNFQLHNELTPKSKKIKALQSKLSSLSVKFSRAKKLSRSTSFSRKKPSITSVMETLKSKLTYSQYVFVSSQLRHTLRNPTGRRWTKEDKSFALSIYMKSPAAYHTLRKVFNLPCIKTLRKSINGIGNRPGFCPQLLDNIKNCVKKFSPLEKLCILCFDEISLKTGLQYNERFDTITGFDYNKQKLATKSLVFMIRGLTKKWKQAIGYFFLSNCTPVSVLKSFLLEAITKVTETGLKLVGMVCDQLPLNQHLYTDLKISSNFPFFQHNNNKIFAFFDAPHLLKSVRNNFKKYTIKFSEYKCAKWCYIEQLYNLDSSQRFRICPRLTKLHMETKGLSSMRVKLSHSVAAGICLLTAAGHLSSEAVYTAEFVGEMDELFDSFNSSTFQNAKEFACTVNINSKHLKMWQDKLKWIESWKFIKENNKFITPPCKKGWILSINAVIQLWEHVQNFGQKILIN